MVRPIGVEPITFWSVVKRSIQLSYERTCFHTNKIICTFFSRWWLQLESNQRHQDFQSCALPTELWSQNKWRFRRELNPRSLAWQASVITATPRNLIFGCRRRIWTSDLWVMSPTSYQAALSCDVSFLFWRRKRDLNPCAAFTTSWFSRPVPSARLGYSSNKMVPRAGLEPARYLTTEGF